MPKREMWVVPPPECGPAAVANVPLTSSARQAPAKPRPSTRSSRGTSGATCPRCSPRASSASTTAPATSSIESSRCVETIGQRRSVFTARYPSGACASVPRKIASASRRDHRGRPGVRREASHAISVTTSATPPTMRFPNSM